MLISEAFDMFIFEEIKLKNGAVKTRQNYLTSKIHILKTLGDFPVEVMSLEHMTRWKMQMDSTGMQSTTMKTYLGHVRSVLKFLASRGMNVMDYRTITLPMIKRSKPTYLDYSEVQAVIDATDSPRDKAIIACLFSTGCRISELLNLNRDDISDMQAVVLGKGTKYRTVYFDKTSYQYLQDYLETRKDRIPALFISGQYRRITVSRVEQILHVLSAEAGLDKNLTPHVLRHSYATDLVVNGANIMAVKDLLGHASITTTQIYTHMSNPHLKNVYEKHHSKA